MSGVTLNPAITNSAAASPSTEARGHDDGAFQAALGDAIAETAPQTAAPKLNGAALSSGDQDKVKARIRKTAQEFEAMFLGQMLEPMFKGLKTEAPFGGGNAENTWRSLLVQEYGKSISKRGGLGVAKIIENQMLDMAGLSAKVKPGQNPQAPAPVPEPNLDAVLATGRVPNALLDPSSFALNPLESK
jgi:Rod binding domain-containing protein